MHRDVGSLVLRLFCRHGRAASAPESVVRTSFLAWPNMFVAPFGSDGAFATQVTVAAHLRCGSVPDRHSSITLKNVVGLNGLRRRCRRRSSPSYSRIGRAVILTAANQCVIFISASMPDAVCPLPCISFITQLRLSMMTPGLVSRSLSNSNGPRDDRPVGRPPFSREACASVACPIQSSVASRARGGVRRAASASRIREAGQGHCPCWNRLPIASH